MGNFYSQPSSSSSSSSNVEGIEKIESRDKALTKLEVSNQDASKSDKIEDGQEEKKLKTDLQSESQDQDELDMKSFIDELPSEMLMEILKYLKVKSLFNCRLVSRKWKEIARKVLNSRYDVEIGFDCRKSEEGNLTIERKIKNSDTSLENFIKCFQTSKEFPLYTRFHFEYFDCWVFDHVDWIKFTCDFGKRVRSMKLKVTCVLNGDDDDLMELAEKLRNLLFNQLPNLGEFGLEISARGRWIWTPVHPLSHIKLFPSSISSKEKSTVQLPSLKVVYLHESSFSKYTGIVTDLILASGNLQKIEPFKKYDAYRRIETFQLLQSLGKLHCLQTVQFELNANFMSEIQGKSAVIMELKLKKLLLFVSPIFKTETFWSDASSFLLKLFESNKDNLIDLTLDFFGFLPHLQLPKFSKLSNLTILGDIEPRKVFPSELNLNKVFPLLQDLELHVPWADFSRHDESQSVSSFPNLKVVKIMADEITKEDIFGISQACPNLTELRTCNGTFGRAIKNFPEVGTAIWTHLTKLESLDLEIDMDSPANTFSAVDSTFTGFSEEDYNRLLELNEIHRWSKSESKIQLEAERINPSILNLKGLKELKVNFACSELGSILGLMCISEECDFKLMKNLDYEIYG